VARYSCEYFERISDCCRPSIPPRSSQAAGLRTWEYSDESVALPTLRHASLQRYIHGLLSLSQHASEPSPNAPARLLTRKAHLLRNIELRLNNIGLFLRFCYKRQLLCISVNLVRITCCTFFLVNPLEEIEFNYKSYSPPASFFCHLFLHHSFLVSLWAPLHCIY
jgi:hypothetical protein